MNGNCLSECFIYKASVSATSNKYYHGTCENALKERYNNHKCSSTNKSCENSTELSKYVWELKEKNINYFIDWDIAMKAQKHVCGSQIYAFVRISLLLEKMLIFCSINVISLSQNAAMEINLL